MSKSGFPQFHRGGNYIRANCIDTVQPITSKPNENEPTPSATETDLCCAVDSATAAKVLGVTRKTLASWRNLGIAPAYLKYGARLGPMRYQLTDLVEWQQAQLRLPASGEGSYE